MTTHRFIGASLHRTEGHSKVTGEAKYVDDFTLPNMLFGTTIRTKNPRGIIKKITYKSGIKWNDFTIVTAADIIGKNIISCIVNDQPCLVDTLFNHAEEPVVLLAHPNREILETAKKYIEIEEEPLPAVLTLDEAISCKNIIYGKDNCLKKIDIEKGNPNSVWASAYKIVEGEYRTGAQEQLYIETNGMVAQYDTANGVTVWGSLQCPYYVQGALKTLFNLPDSKVRVIQLETGGAFGGKEDYPSILACHAALLAQKAKRPVKMIYDRREDLAATTKRHPSRTLHKTAVSQDGQILAMEIDFVLDGGAYSTLSTVVVSRGALHAAGVYSCPHVHINARAVATNTPPNGAFRGFGAPQSLFAIERHIEQVAKAVGMSSEQFRQKNFLKTGDTTPSGQVIRDQVNLHELFEQAMHESDFYNKRTQYAQQNINSNHKRGIGMSVFMHGAGFTGSGESYLASVAGIEGTSDGFVNILAANTEMGQGKNTVFTQIVADALGIETSCIKVAQPDTHMVPNSGPTVASRSTMIVGKLLERAATSFKQILIQANYLQPHYSSSEFTDAIKNYVLKKGIPKAYAEFEAPAHIKWNDTTYQGDAYSTYAWGVYIAEVMVDTTTYETSVTNFTALQEVGKVVNPVLAEGQIQGGVAQAIGFALLENSLYKNGRMINNQLTNYIIPTIVDTPNIRVIFAESPCPWGPAGAKGIGELPLDGPAPAVLNAIENALGVSLNTIPALPENIFNALTKEKKGV